MRTGVQLLRLCSSPGVSTEGQVEHALGLGDVSTRDPEKGGEQKLPAELPESHLRTTCQTNSRCAVGRVFVRVALWMRLDPP